jgi:radical SAM superfamily enzyme YgiQ (UPF0313 family)
METDDKEEALGSIQLAHFHTQWSYSNWHNAKSHRLYPMVKPFKLLLLQPPVEDFYDTDVRLQPIGLAFLKAAVLKAFPEVQVKIIDFHHGWGRKTKAIPKELSYLRPYYPVHDKSPFSVFYQYYRFGASNATIVEEVLKENPDMIGISSLFTAYYREVLSMASAIKAAVPVPLLVGGSHVSAFPESMLRHPAVDYVLQGEAEESLVALLRVLLPSPKNKSGELSAIAGLGYKDQAQLHLNAMGPGPDLAQLPIPDLSDLDANKYLYEGKPMCCLVTSRSCPHRCSFCSVHLTFGTQYRKRSPAAIVDEIAARYQQGYRVFDFEDDNLTFYKKDMLELLEGIEARLPFDDLQFVAMNGISYLSLDAELLTQMKRVGFTHLNLSLVTSDKAVRESTKRPHTVEKYLEIVHLGRQLGFKMVSYQILGIPGESLDSMLQTLAFNAQQPVLLGASMYYDAPSIAKERKYQSDEAMFKIRLSAMAIESDEVKREDVYSLFVTTRILNFLKGLTFEHDMTWSEILKYYQHQPEAQDLARIQQVLAGHELKARDPEETILSKFKSSILLNVLQRCSWVMTQSGHRISINLKNGVFQPKAESMVH